MSAERIDSSSAGHHPHAANTGTGSGTIHPNETNLQTSKNPKSNEQILRRPQSAGSEQRLTEQNLIEHTKQQALLMTASNNDTNLHHARIAGLAHAVEEFGISPYELRAERTMQNSQAANSMEWFLMEDDRNQRARTFPCNFTGSGDHYGRGYR